MLQISASMIDLIKNNFLVVIQSGGPNQRFIDSILSCIVQVILDPFSRTIEGFCTLLRKDWFLEGYIYIYVKEKMEEEEEEEEKKKKRRS
jgi:hypothetical protein